MSDEGGVAAVERALVDPRRASPIRTAAQPGRAVEAHRPVQEHGPAPAQVAREVRLPAAHRRRLVPPRLQGAAARRAVPAALPHRRASCRRFCAQIVDELHEGASFYVRDERSGCACTASRRRARCAIDPRGRPPAAHGRRRGPRPARLQRALAASASTRSARTCTPPRSASATRRPRPWPAPVFGLEQQAHRRAQRLRPALPHRSRWA